MASTDDSVQISRIFIKGLPPTITDADLKKHFSQNGKLELTDAKLFNHRRIGYVGYKKPEDARLAVKYFNKSFIRMSRVGVELARPYVGQAVQEGDRNAQAAMSNEPKRVRGAENIDLQSKPDSSDLDDPKLKEYLESMKPHSKKRRAWEAETDSRLDAKDADKSGRESQSEGHQSDEDYEMIPQKSSKRRKNNNHMNGEQADTQPLEPNAQVESQLAYTGDVDKLEVPAAPSDADWMRNRTSRLLGILDDDEEEAEGTGVLNAAEESRAADIQLGNSTSEEEGTSGKNQSRSRKEETQTSIPSSEYVDQQSANDKDVEAVRSSMRLFLRNLSYDTKAEDLEKEFAVHGNIEEVHVPRDQKSGRAKGFAYIQFGDADAAEQAFRSRDGNIFQGRLLHVLPASARRQDKLDDFELSKLPLKKQQLIKKRREAASSTFNWNTLYMNADAVVSSVAARLGIAKSEVLDPTSSDAAVKQAHAETHVIQETKSFFKSHGVDLDAFKKSPRGDVAILAKNIPFDCSRDELRRLFEQYGDITLFLMPPSGVIAIIQFANAAQCRSAFAALAYRRVKSSMLFLEKAPKQLFVADATSSGGGSISTNEAPKPTTAELKEADAATSSVIGATATLFIRNLNFSTTTAVLIKCFQPLDGFLSARVKTKTDPKKPGQVLSMGFGFAEFRSENQAQVALKVIDGTLLEGHKLQVRLSHKGADAAEQRRKSDIIRKSTGRHTKVVIKNLPFEATKKDIRALFGSYGQLRSVRLPKKMDRGARGFAFADFTTPKEAESAIEALRDTHLLGRRLVLDFADEAPEDAEKEIERMQEKVGKQVNRVALQKLTGVGRKKFSSQQEQDE